MWPSWWRAPARCASTCSAWAESCASRANNTRSCTSRSPRARTRPSRANDGENTLLTADLVRGRRKGTELLVTELGAKQKPRAVELAQAYVALAEAYVGEKRSELEEAFEGVGTQASERK